MVNQCVSSFFLLESQMYDFGYGCSSFPHTHTRKHVSTSRPGQEKEKDVAWLLEQLLLCDRSYLDPKKDPMKIGMWVKDPKFMRNFESRCFCSHAQILFQFCLVVDSSHSGPFLRIGIIQLLVTPSGNLDELTI